MSDTIEIPIDLVAVTPKAASLTMLAGNTIQAHNDFDHPETLCPHVTTLETPNNGLTVTLEPASVNVLQIKI